MTHPSTTVRIDQPGAAEAMKLVELEVGEPGPRDRKSTRLNSSHG